MTVGSARAIERCVVDGESLYLTDADLGLVEVGLDLAARARVRPADGLDAHVLGEVEARRRRLVDEPEYDQVANYESLNEAYVVEEYELAVLVENIALGEAPARPDPVPCAVHL